MLKNFWNRTWWGWKDCKLSPKHIPNMFDKIQIRRVCRPHQALDIHSFKEVINQTCTVTRCFIIHDYAVRTDSTLKQPIIRAQEVSAFFTSHRPHLEHIGCPIWCLPMPLFPQMESNDFPLCFLIENETQTFSISLPNDNLSSDFSQTHYWISHCLTSSHSNTDNSNSSLNRHVYEM